MKNIVLMCSQGASTSILVKKIEQAASAQNIEVTVNAYSVNNVEEIADVADVIILGPQVAFLKNKVESDADCPVIVADMMKYGMMDGKGILEDALKLIEG